MTTMPNPLSLARHYYEARREVLAAAGAQATPWYRLNADERAVAIAESTIIQEAIRRANEEHTALLDAIAARLTPADAPQRGAGVTSSGPPTYL
ncbi:hypothetical protein [Streptomyces sp. NPDC050485]|uniref:hypothetical protein n=1 Tax=Streptomyces sp. NPDC050485 TaxID=3365617 RepID=UPI0037A69769